MAIKSVVFAVTCPNCGTVIRLIIPFLTVLTYMIASVVILIYCNDFDLGDDADVLLRLSFSVTRTSASRAKKAE